MNVWIELFTIAVELAYIWYFFSSALGMPRASNRKSALIFAGLGGSLTLLTLFLPNALMRVCLLSIVVLIALWLLYDTFRLETIYLTVLFFALAILSDLICGSLLTWAGMSFAQILGTGSMRLIYNCVGKVTHLTLLHLALSIIRTRRDSSALWKALPLLLCHIICIWIGDQIFLRLRSGEPPAEIIVESLGLLYISFIACYYVEYLQRSFEAQQEAVRAKEQLEIQSRYYQSAIKNQEETRALWHDIKKYVTVMEALVVHEQSDAAKECLSELQGSLDEIGHFVDVEHPVLSSILSYGMEQANRAGVRLDLDVWVDKAFTISPSDLYIIVGNTIDNAIEACVSLPNQEDRIITLKLQQRNHLIYYEISNLYQEGKEVKSGSIHGYGLKNVGRCVEKNNGTIAIRKENGQFTVQIYLTV